MKRLRRCASRDGVSCEVVFVKSTDKSLSHPLISLPLIREGCRRAGALAARGAKAHQVARDVIQSEERDWAHVEYVQRIQVAITAAT